MRKFLSCFLFLIVFLSINNFIPISRSYAQTSYNDASSYLPQTNPDVPHNLTTLTHGFLIGVLSESICVLTGSNPTTPDHRCLDWDKTTGKIGYASSSSNKGALGLMTNLIAETFVLPVHFSPYMQYVAQSFNPTAAHKSLAATNANNETGIGAQGLDPILTIWLGFRNISYLLVVIVFMVIGIAIMFRVKIDPRTVMSLQNQIPKIIIGLIIITFSFAISGFLIDMTYVLTLLFLNLIAQAVGDNTLANTIFSSPDPFNAANAAFHSTGGLFSTINTIGVQITNIIHTIVENIPVLGGIERIFEGITFILCTILVIFANPCGDIHNWAGGLLGLIVGLAILISVITALFKFWLALVNAYITILFTVILAPLRILMGGLPGTPGGGFVGYLRDLSANLLIFPVCLSYLFLAAEIARLINQSNTTAFMMPLVPAGNIAAVIAYVAILHLPALPGEVLKALKSEVSPLATAAGQGIGIGAAAVGRTFGKSGKSIGGRLFREADPYRHLSEGVLLSRILGSSPNSPVRNFYYRIRGIDPKSYERAREGFGIVEPKSVQGGHQGGH